MGRQEGGGEEGKRQRWGEWETDGEREKGGGGQRSREN